MGMNKNIIWIIGVIGIIDLIVLFTTDSYLLAMTMAILSVVAILRLVKNFITDMVILGGFLGLISAYHFYFQPTLNLPEMNGATMIFIGSFIVTRIVFLVSRRIPIPYISPLVHIIAGGK